MTEKTREEELLEKLRDVDARLKTMKQYIGSSKSDFEGKLERAEKRHKDASGEAKFVKVGSVMVEGTDHLAALLDMEECYVALLDLKNKHPTTESVRLLNRKIKIIKELIQISN